MFRRIRTFVRSPLGRRTVAYLAPFVVGWVVRKLQGGGRPSGTKRRQRKP